MLVSFKLWKENTEKEKCLNIFTHQFQTITYHLNELLILLSFMFMYIYLPCQAACIITWLKAHLLTHKLGTHVLLQTKHLKIITAVAVTANLLPMMFKFQLGQSCSCYPKFQTVYLKGKYILSVCKYRAAALYLRGCLNFSGGRRGIPAHQVFVTVCVAMLFSTRWLFIVLSFTFSAE